MVDAVSVATDTTPETMTRSSLTTIGKFLDSGAECGGSDEAISPKMVQMAARHLFIRLVPVGGESDSDGMKPVAGVTYEDQKRVIEFLWTNGMENMFNENDHK